LGPATARVIPLLDADASETRLKKILKEDPTVGFLHIAAHGLTSQEHNNLFGALALATPRQPTVVDDGFLSLYEVYELKLGGCELAVLSACETNCGPDSPLEAGSTMARAFICAGSRRVVCSHWDVSDQATAPLVGRFMEKVARNIRDAQIVDYAAALQAAKKSLRDDLPTSAPWLWAPFVLVGTPTGHSPNYHSATVTADNR
jgi:CHAT domain-containing protein